MMRTLMRYNVDNQLQHHPSKRVLQTKQSFAIGNKYATINTVTEMTENAREE